MSKGLDRAEWLLHRLPEAQVADQVRGQARDRRKWPDRPDWVVFSPEECQNLNLPDLDLLHLAMGTLEAQIVTLLRLLQNLPPPRELLCLLPHPLPRGRMFQYLHLPFGPVGFDLSQ
jgi:hypothetical protein